jgi:hypothetical protein
LWRFCGGWNRLSAIAFRDVSLTACPETVKLSQVAANGNRQQARRQGIPPSPLEKSGVLQVIQSIPLATRSFRFDPRCPDSVPVEFHSFCAGQLTSRGRTGHGPLAEAECDRAADLTLEQPLMGRTYVVRIHPGHGIHHGMDLSWQARRWRCKISCRADHSSCKGIDSWLARPRWRGFFWDFAFHGRLLLTNRPRFHAQQRSRSSRRSIAPLDICKPKAPPG